MGTKINTRAMIGVAMAAAVFSASPKPLFAQQSAAKDLGVQTSQAQSAIPIPVVSLNVGYLSNYVKGSGRVGVDGPVSQPSVDVAFKNVVFTEWENFDLKNGVSTENDTRVNFLTDPIKVSGADLRFALCLQDWRFHTGHDEHLVIPTAEVKSEVGGNPVSVSARLYHLTYGGGWNRHRNDLLVDFSGQLLKSGKFTCNGNLRLSAADNFLGLHGFIYSWTGITAKWNLSKDASIEMLLRRQSSNDPVDKVPNKTTVGVTLMLRK